MRIYWLYHIPTLHSFIFRCWLAPFCSSVLLLGISTHFSWYSNKSRWLYRKYACPANNRDNNRGFVLGLENFFRLFYSGADFQFHFISIIYFGQFIAIWGLDLYFSMKFNVYWCVVVLEASIGWILFHSSLPYGYFKCQCR